MNSKSKNNKNYYKYWVWLALALPASYILQQYLSDTISYGTVIHQTGDWSFAFLFLALAVTPLRRILPKAKWLRVLLFHRRAIGVASFGYAAFHTVAYLQRKWGADLILKESMDPGIATGWLALFIFIILAVTSNNISVKMLGRKWQLLHRTVYVSAILLGAHWILTAFEPLMAYIWLGLLFGVELLRFIPRKKSPA